MSRILAPMCLLSLLAITPTIASADTDIGTDKATGVGINVSGLTQFGITGKHFLNENGALVGTVAIHHGFSVQAGYVHTIATLWDGGENGQLDIGGGGDAIVWFFDVGPFSEEIVGVRPFAEVVFRFAVVPVEISADFGPTIYVVSDLTDNVDFDSFGLSGRFFF